MTRAMPVGPLTTLNNNNVNYHVCQETTQIGKNGTLDNCHRTFAPTPRTIATQTIPPDNFLLLIAKFVTLHCR